jgi:hypothetical protein
MSARKLWISDELLQHLQQFVQLKAWEDHLELPSTIPWRENDGQHNDLLGMFYGIPIYASDIRELRDGRRENRCVDLRQVLAGRMQRTCRKVGAATRVQEAPTKGIDAVLVVTAAFLFGIFMGGIFRHTHWLIGLTVASAVPTLLLAGIGWWSGYDRLFQATEKCDGESRGEATAGLCSDGRAACHQDRDRS